MILWFCDNRKNKLKQFKEVSVDWDELIAIYYGSNGLICYADYHALETCIN